MKIFNTVIKELTEKKYLAFSVHAFYNKESREIVSKNTTEMRNTIKTNVFVAHSFVTHIYMLKTFAQIR